MTKLSKRLGLLVNLIKPGQSVADIGSDHAALALYLVENGIAPSVIVSELGEGPYNIASRAVEHSPFRARIFLRQGDGLQVLLHGEVDTVILAGMGGDTIVEILGYDWQKSATYSHYLFQPMSKDDVLRRNLVDHGWQIEYEQLVKENHRLYIVIAARPNQGSYQMTDLELEIGPIILKADDPLKREYLQRRLRKWRSIYDKMVAIREPELSKLAGVYRDKIVRLEEILNGSYG